MLRTIAVILLLTFIALSSAAQIKPLKVEVNRDGKRPVTVADAIEMTQIGDHSYLTNSARTGNVVQFSPDHSKFAFVTQKGNLRNDTVEFALLVFRTAEAFVSPRPHVVATMASSSNREGIRQVQWLPDNETIVFLGEQPGDNPQIYKVNTRTEQLVQLTKSSTPIIAYSMSGHGDSFIYIAGVGPRSVVSNQLQHHGFFVTVQSWNEIYTNRRPVDSRHQIFVKTPRMKVPQRVDDHVDLNAATASGLSISPNGKYALLRMYTTSPPVIWKDYQYKVEREITQSATACNAEDTTRCPEQLYIIDLDKKTIDPLLNVPLVTKPPAGYVLTTWTGQSSIFLVNTLLPLDPLDSETRIRRLSHVYAAEVTLPERKITTITERQEPYPAFFIASDYTTNEIVIKTDVATLGTPLAFRKDVTGWHVREIDDVQSQSENRLSVTLDQDINSPPQLVAHDPQTKRTSVVLDLNPQFSQLSFGHVEIFPWATREGQQAEGTLYYPPGYIAGKKYPLIIQTHHETRERFWIDGPYTTAYAAQPLANKGFFVLQMGLVDVYDKASIDQLYKYLGTPKEGEHYMALFESAIDALDQRGLVDRSLVGLTGFSRTESHVLYALTHSHYHFAAAVAADGVSFGYVGCLYYLARMNSALCEKMNGGAPPYGDSLLEWARSSPEFRLNKIDAPLLLQAISFPIGEWEIFAGLQWLDKPVEMLNFYPEGQHELVKPQQRLLSQGSVVDWYCFWLKGEEDPDPAKIDQYTRWRQMRQKQDKNTSTMKD